MNAKAGAFAYTPEEILDDLIRRRQGDGRDALPSDPRQDVR